MTRNELMHATPIAKWEKKVVKRTYLPEVALMEIQGNLLTVRTSFGDNNIFSINKIHYSHAGYPYIYFLGGRYFLNELHSIR